MNSKYLIYTKVVLNLQLILPIIEKLAMIKFQAKINLHKLSTPNLNNYLKRKQIPKNKCPSFFANLKSK